MDIIINEVIRKKRREMNISQESLAESFGITVQAVSKWETGLSYPDITMLPKIAEYFNITLNELFCGETEVNEKDVTVLKDIPDDGKLRIVQCIGARVLNQNEYKKGEVIELAIPDSLKNKSRNEIKNGTFISINENTDISLEVWGDARIEGDVNGNVNAGAGINCGNVSGNASAGLGIGCANVGGNAIAGAGLTCTNVGGNVNAGHDINCKDIYGSADAGSNITCSSIKGSADAGGNISCNGSIYGNADAGGSITCSNVKGKAECDG